MKTKQRIVIASAFLGFTSLSIGVDNLTPDVGNDITSFLGTKDAKSLGRVNKDFQTITEGNLECPIFQYDYIESHISNLANVEILTTSNIIGQDITSPKGRKFTITYLRMTFLDNFLSFMKAKKITSLSPITDKQNVLDLLGHKHKDYVSKKYCVYNLHARFGDGSATLVIERKEQNH
jgi:hypothetical protein